MLHLHDFQCRTCKIRDTLCMRCVMLYLHALLAWCQMPYLHDMLRLTCTVCNALPARYAMLYLYDVWSFARMICNALHVTSLSHQSHAVSVSQTYFALLSFILGIRSIIAMCVTYVLAHVAASYNTRVLNIPHTSDVPIVPASYILNMHIHTWYSYII